MDTNRFHEILSKLRERITKHDCQRLDTFLGDNITQRLQEDLSLCSTLFTISSLFDQDNINEEDMLLIINAANDIQCTDFAQYLKQYMKQMQLNEVKQSSESLIPLVRLTMPQNKENFYLKNGKKTAVLNSNNTKYNPFTVVLDDPARVSLRSKRKQLFRKNPILQTCLLLFIILSIILTAIVIGRYFKIIQLKMKYENILNEQQNNKEIIQYLNITQSTNEQNNKYLNDIKSINEENNQYLKTIQSTNEENKQNLKDIKSINEENNQYLKTIQSTNEENKEDLKDIKSINEENNQYLKTIQSKTEENKEDLKIPSFNYNETTEESNTNEENKEDLKVPSFNYNEMTEESNTNEENKEDLIVPSFNYNEATQESTTSEENKEDLIVPSFNYNEMTEESNTNEENKEDLKVPSFNYNEMTEESTTNKENTEDLKAT